MFISERGNTSATVIDIKVKEIMAKNVVVCSVDDPVSSALAKMKNYKIHQLPVLNKSQVAGVITLESIVKKEIDPASTKVSTLMNYCPVISPEASTEDAIELILGSNMRALPVFDTELRGILSENDVIKHVKINSSLEGKEAVVVEEKDNVGKVKHIMSYENLSRVPVVNNGKCVGVVGTIELIKIVEGKQKFAGREGRMKDRGYKESLNIDETLVTAIMREPVVLKANAKNEQILEKLRQHEEVLIENGSLKIITPKDVLRMLVKPRKFAYVQITGLDKNDAEHAEKTQKEAEIMLKKISRATEIQPLKIMVERHKKEGGKTKYSVSAQLPTQLGTFISTKAYGWNYVTVMQQSLKNLEREFFRKFEKQRTQKKRGRMKG